MANKTEDKVFLTGTLREFITRVSTKFLKTRTCPYLQTSPQPICLRQPEYHRLKLARCVSCWRMQFYITKLNLSFSVNYTSNCNPTRYLKVIFHRCVGQPCWVHFDPLPVVDTLFFIHQLDGNASTVNKNSQKKCIKKTETSFQM